MAPPRDPCPQCGSMRFEETDAIWYCHEGHAQEGGPQTEIDDDDFRRVGKTSRQKQSNEKQKTLKVYRGGAGFQLYLKAWQHILWKQCHTLIHQYGLPNELWNLVRELWALRLSVLVTRLEESSELEPPYASDSSALSDNDVDTQHHTDKGSRNLGAGTMAKSNPTLPDTISLVYVGVLLLRHPLSLATIYTYVRQEQLCYIRSIRHVPREIRDRLAPEYHLALDTTVVPSRKDLQFAVYRTAVIYGVEFEMVLPPLNWTLRLMDNIHILALPLEIFPAVKCLTSTLNYNFQYSSRADQRRNATSYPEAQLMALIVIATKLLFPFDSETKQQRPYSTTEPAAVELNWDSWFQTRSGVQCLDAKESLTTEQAIEVTDRDISQMSGDQLDQYMDWFQRTYAKDIGVSPLQKQILDMFPFVDTANSGGESDKVGRKVTAQEMRRRLKATQAGLEVVQTVPQNDGNLDPKMVERPGQHYQHYHSTDAMTATVRRFHQDAADAACLSIDDLLKACVRTERLLVLHQKEQSRSEYFEEEGRSTT